LVKYVPQPDDFTTEKIKTWEIGYKTLLGGKLYIDAFLYRSVYNDFIATQNYYQPINNKVEDLKSSSTYRTYQINFNNFNEIFVNGWGAGVEYAFGKGYNVGFNYANQVGLITLKDNLGVTRKDAFGNEIVKRKMSDPVVSQVGRNFFISPEHRFNITFSNPKVTKRIGYNVAFRWTSKMWVEQGNTQGDVMLPSWTSLDAAVTYAIPSVNGSIKIGGSNLLNNYYSQGYGLAQIGGIYYVGFTVDGL
jgi:iron complex outermembrane recepter protein